MNDRVRQELDGLVKDGTALVSLLETIERKAVPDFASKYQSWYTRALMVVGTLLPDRLSEFRANYERSDKRKSINAMTYVLQDLVNGIRAPNELWDSRKGRYVESFDMMVVGVVRLRGQIDILTSASSRLDDLLSNLRGVLQASLFDSELEAARHLLSNGHIRAAGAVAGVVLEGHLADVCASHQVPITKRDPNVSDFNDALKSAGILTYRIGDGFNG